MRSPQLYRDRLVGLFLESYLPVNERHGLDQRSSYAWLQLAAAEADPGKPLSDALSALSMTRLGRIQKNPDLLLRGIQRYGDALREVQKALWNPDDMWKIQTLAATKVLGLYEIHENSTESVQGWTLHEEGLQRLYRLRGPERYLSPLARLLFEDFCYTTVIAPLVFSCAS